MPRQKKELFGKIINFFELPQDVIMDLPRLVINGNERLVIENHRGLIEYSDQIVRVSTTQGEIRISGERLNLISIEKEEIWLEGRIDRVELPEWRG